MWWRWVKRVECELVISFGGSNFGLVVIFTPSVESLLS